MQIGHVELRGRVPARIDIVPLARSEARSGHETLRTRQNAGQPSPQRCHSGTDADELDALGRSERGPALDQTDGLGAHRDAGGRIATRAAADTRCARTYRRLSAWTIWLYTVRLRQGS